MQSLVDKETKLRVSTVLNKDTKSYGKQFLCDGKEETCWNSDQGDSQWIIVNLARPARLARVEFKFQGGFCSSHVQVEVLNKEENKFDKLTDLYPLDSNSSQSFDVAQDERSSDCYRILFDKLTDFFGRLIIYDFQLYGQFIE